MGDIQLLEKSAIRDGFWWNEQQKTGVKVKIPLDLYMPAIDMTLQDAFKRCQDNVLSKRLIHLSRNTGSSKAGDAPNPATLSYYFKNFITEAGYVCEEGKTVPTFHEIRSLSSRLYTDLHGKDFSQALPGHKTSQMADMYRDSRGAEWAEVKIKAS